MDLDATAASSRRGAGSSRGGDLSNARPHHPAFSSVRDIQLNAHSRGRGDPQARKCGALLTDGPFSRCVRVRRHSMHVLRGFSLTLGSAITVLATVNLLRSPLAFLPLVLQQLQEAQLSLGRMQVRCSNLQTSYTGYRV